MVMLNVVKKHFELMQMDSSIPEKSLIMVFDFTKSIETIEIISAHIY